MNKIKKILLFVHPMPRLQERRNQFIPVWEDFLTIESRDKSTVVCLIKNKQREIEYLAQFMENKFGDRCFINHSDNSDVTKILIARDLQKTLSERGSREEWCPYEMQTSCDCRGIAQGLKQEFKNRGFEYNPEDIDIVSCGQEWGGCLIKYSMFVSRYLGYNSHVDIRPELTPNAGFPTKAEYLQKHNLADNVCLFIFRLSDGRLMGQYYDTCRAIWECTHIAVLDIDIKDNINDIEYATYSPFVYLKTREVYPVDNKVVAAVGDGVYPAVTTICNMSMPEDVFIEKLKTAKVQKRLERNYMQYAMGFKEYEVSSCTDDYKGIKWGKY